MCHCSNTGVERTPNKSQQRKLTLVKKILPPLLPGFELATPAFIYPGSPALPLTN